MKRNPYRDAEKLEKKKGDPTKIVALLKESAGNGNANAQYALGTLYLHGKYVSKDSKLALDYLEAASTKMHPGALFDLGVSYEQGEIRNKDESKAFRSYLLSMIFGDKSAIYEVARCFYYGIGVNKDRAVYEILMMADDHIKGGDGLD